MNAKIFSSKSMRSQFKVLNDSKQNPDKDLLLEFTNEVDAIGPPVHFHPVQTEVYEILEGTLGVEVDGKKIILHTGDKATIPPNAKHTFWTEEKDRVKFTSRHIPALKFEEFLTSIYELDVDGKVGKNGMPNFIRLNVMLNDQIGEQYIAGPPVFIQNFLSRTLGLVGKLFGYTPYYRAQI